MSYIPIYKNKKRKYGLSGGPVYLEDLYLGGKSSSGVFSPDQLAGLQVWLKADSLALNDNDPVASWLDSTSNHIDVLQGIAGSKPLFKTNIINGKPIVRFDGIDDVLESTAILIVPQPLTAFAVSKFIQAGTNDSIFDSNNSTQRATIYKQNTDKLSFFAGTEVPEAVAETIPTAFFYLSGIFNGASSKLYKNGINISSGNVGAQGLGNERTSTFRVGSANAGTSFYHGDIAEIIIYNSALSDTDRQSVETYLKNKYGL